jgi:hypothetical protein
MRCTVLTLLVLSVPMAVLSACAEPIEAAAPVSANAPVFTTDPQYFARQQAYVTESTYLAGSPFYTTDFAYFSGPTRVANGYCPPRGSGHAHAGGHHR